MTFLVIQTKLAISDLYFNVTEKDIKTLKYHDTDRHPFTLDKLGINQYLEYEKYHNTYMHPFTLDKLCIKQYLEYEKYHKFFELKYLSVTDNLIKNPCLNTDHILTYGSSDDTTYKPTKETADFITNIIKILYYMSGKDPGNLAYEDYIVDKDIKKRKTVLTEIKLSGPKIVKLDEYM